MISFRQLEAALCGLMASGEAEGRRTCTRSEAKGGQSERRRQPLQARLTSARNAHQSGRLAAHCV